MGLNVTKAALNTHTHTQSAGSNTLNGDMHRNANDMYNIKVGVNIFDQ